MLVLYAYTVYRKRHCFDLLICDTHQTILIIFVDDKVVLLSTVCKYYFSPSHLVFVYCHITITTTATPAAAATATFRTSFGKRSFSTAAPSVWNSLPTSVLNCDSLTLFKARLKTHLFSSVTG